MISPKSDNLPTPSTKHTNNPVTAPCNHIVTALSDLDRGHPTLVTMLHHEVVPVLHVKHPCWSVFARSYQQFVVSTQMHCEHSLRVPDQMAGLHLRFSRPQHYISVFMSCDDACSVFGYFQWLYCVIWLNWWFRLLITRLFIHLKMK